MIDYKDLMVGDWVTLAGNGVYPDTQIRITELSQEGGFVDDCDNFIGYEELSPIPLTEDILVKNGFEIDKGYAVLQLSEGSYLDFYLHEHRLRKVWEGIDEWNNHAKVRDVSFVCQCYYVHEFQHALRLCGIEKKIEL